MSSRGIQYLDVTHEIVNQYMASCGLDEPTVCQHLRSALKNMSEQWYSGIQPNLQYGEPIRQVAYVYGHMAVNARFVQRIFSGCRDLQSCFDTAHAHAQRVKICVFGAGPGTELLGIAGWIKSRNLRYLCNVDFTMFDVVDEWRSGLEIVINNVYSRAQTSGISVMGECIPHYGPTADLRSFAHWEEIDGHDIYVFSYVLSEIMANENSLRALQRLGSHLA